MVREPSLGQSHGYRWVVMVTILWRVGLMRQISVTLKVENLSRLLSGGHEEGGGSFGKRPWRGQTHTHTHTRGTVSVSVTLICLFGGNQKEKHRRTRTAAENDRKRRSEKQTPG